MVKGGLCLLGILLGSVSALPFIWWGGVKVSVCQYSDIAFVYFSAFVIALFQDVILAGTKPFGHRQGAEIVPWLGRECVPLWSL